MRKLLSALFVAMFIFSSCGSNKSSDNVKEAEEAINEATEGSGESGDFKEAKNCDEFIDQYEKWMDDYLKLVEEYMNNPMDAAKSEEFLKLSQEGANWAQQWSTKFIMCASKEKYQKRFEEIAKKAEKKMEELGLQ